MEVAGLLISGLSLATLFSTCVGCLELVESGRNLGRDHVFLDAELSKLKIHLVAWGKACGLTNPQGHDPRLNNSNIKAHIQTQLNCIALLFVDANKLAKRYRLRKTHAFSSTIDKRNAATVEFVENDDHTSVIMQESMHDFLSRIKKTQIQARSLSAARWSLWDKRKLTDLIRNLEKCIKELEWISERLDLLNTQRTYVELEVQSISEVERLESIAAVSRSGEDVVSDAASERLSQIRRLSSPQTGVSPVKSQEEPSRQSTPRRFFEIDTPHAETDTSEFVSEQPSNRPDQGTVLPAGSARINKVQGNLVLVKEIGGSDKDIDLICIPDANLESACEAPWVTTLAEELPLSYRQTSRVFEFRFALEKSSDLLSSLLAQSDCLLTEIFKYRNFLVSKARPLVYVCHGIGGIILKRTIGFLSCRSDDDALQTAANPSGIVFLGTPHLPLSDPLQWTRLSLIFRSFQSIDKATLAVIELEAPIVARICADFEGSNTCASILSVYETESTKLRDKLFASKTLLVDRALATTNLSREILIAAEADHYGVSVIRQGSATWAALKLLLQDVQNDWQGLKPQTNRTLSTNSDIFESSSTETEIEHRDIQAVVPTSSNAFATAGSTAIFYHEMVPMVLDFTNSIPTIELPRYIIPKSPPLFFGRQDMLSSMDEVLLSTPNDLVSSENLRSLVLCGLGGIGKTTMARYYVNSRKNNFDAIFWIQADDSFKLADGFARTARDLGLVDQNDPQDWVVSRELVLGWLSSAQRDPIESQDSANLQAHWLLVFDNADDPNILQDYLPIVGTGRVLLTSRNRGPSFLYPHVKVVELESFSIEDSAEFLKDLTYKPERREDYAGFRELLDHLDGHPLAITQLASFQQREKCTFEELIKEYNESRSSLRERNDSSTLKIDISSPINFALQNLNPEAEKLLDLLSMLHPDQVPAKLLEKGVQSGTEMLKPRLSARSDLVRLALIIYNPQIEVLTIHRLVQHTVRLNMSEKRFNDAFESAVGLLIGEMPKENGFFRPSISTWSIMETLFAHVFHLMQVYREKTPALMPKEQVHFLRLLQQLGWFLKERASLDEALSVLRFALNACERSERTVPTIHADLLFALSSTHAELNQPIPALELARRHFNMRLDLENESGKLLYGAVTAHSQLGLAYLLNGEPEQAIVHCEDARRIAENIPKFAGGSKYWPFLAITHHAWALIALNRGREIVDMLKSTLEWVESNSGADFDGHFESAYTWQLLGTVYDSENQQEESLIAFQESLRLYRLTAGDSFHRTNHVCVRLAAHYARNGQIETASVFFDQAIRYFKQQSFYKPELARTLHKTAEFLKHHESDAAGNRLEDDANKIFRELKSDFDDEHVPKNEDYDSIVPIWAR